MIPLVLLMAGNALPATTNEQGPVFAVMEENDLIVKTDRHYTQGIKLCYLLRDGVMPSPVRWISGVLPTIGYTESADKFGLSIGQSIFTPSDIQITELQVNDRPYAGWLYCGLTLQRRGTFRGFATVLESIDLQLGVIGPESLAKEAQTWIHEIRGFPLPKGWAHQLGTEPGLALRYSRGYRLSPEGLNPRFFDVIPEAGFSLGNVETSFRAGVYARLGWNLPDDFGVQTISSLRLPDGGWSAAQRRRAWGFYGFAGFEGWAVAYNEFLDGNMFQSSHSIAKESYVTEFKSGFAVVLRNLEFGFVFVERSREFVGQPGGDSYGSAFLKVRF